jgi:nucleoside-diphosphate-sugar epimerase
MGTGTERRLLIFGAGYSAKVIAKRVQARYDLITGTVRTQQKAQLLHEAGINSLIFGDDTDAELTGTLAQADHVLVSIAPDEVGDPVLRKFGENLLASDRLKWICYLSSVGVYGDHKGAWVDETSVCYPPLKRYERRLEAEHAWRELARALGIPLAIFRLSGIYGPGRNAFVNIEQGRTKRVIKPGQVFNRIHCDDIALAFECAMAIRAGGIFNITDDKPAPPQDVVTLAHELHGSTPPPEMAFDQADMTPMARSFYSQNKRVSNARSKAVLGMQYSWPDYETALRRMWREQSWQG